MRQRAKKSRKSGSKKRPTRLQVRRLLDVAIKSSYAAGSIVLKLLPSLTRLVYCIWVITYVSFSLWSLALAALKVTGISGSLSFTVSSICILVWLCTVFITVTSMAISLQLLNLACTATHSSGGTLAPCKSYGRVPVYGTLFLRALVVSSELL